jgi:cystathionine beta-lyase family protein involved in aluminum resistance
MIILVNDVTISISVGANTIKVRITAILIVFTNCAGSFVPATERLTIGGESTANAKIENSNNVIINLKKNPIKK